MIELMVPGKFYWIRAKDGPEEAPIVGRWNARLDSFSICGTDEDYASGDFEVLGECE